MRLGSMLALGALLSTVTMAGVASAQTNPNFPVTNNAAVRGERGSDRNLIKVRKHLEKLIDELQRDQHDFGGNRVKAIADLQAARADVDAALQWDRSHRGQ